MSTAPKGYPSTQKLDRITADYASVTPVSANQNGLEVKAAVYVYEVTTDAVDAGTTANQIIAAGIEAVARKGDIIRFTSGAASGLEVVVNSVTTDTAILAEEMSPVPSTMDTFSILRFIHPVATNSGGVSTAFTFTRNGSTQAVTEDTVTPANNRPLPVKIESTSGEVTINAGDLDVNINHDGSNFSSVRIGDGTTLAGITTANELKVNATTFTGRIKANPPVTLDYTGTPVTTAAYTELVASHFSKASKIQIFDSSGETLVFALGGVGVEVDQFYIFPGGVEIDYTIMPGARISIKAVSGNATSGYIAANFLT